MAQSLSQIPLILEKYNFDFSNLSDRLKCVLCHDILKNTKQTSCGCKVCDKCIKYYLSDGSRSCPSKQSNCANVILNINEDIHQDNATNKEIGNLVVKCPFDSCQNRSVLRNMVEHIDSCEFRDIICEKCENKFLAKEKEKHDKEKCEMRLIKCEFCGFTMNYKDMKNIHLNVDRDELCSKLVGICPNNCKETGKVNLKEHIKICANKKLECPFHHFDCKIDKMTKENLVKHMEEEYLSHTSSLISTVKNLEQIIDNLKQELENQIRITKELFDMNKKSSESRLKIEKTIDELKKKGPGPTIQTVDNKSVIFRNASFIWKFTDFEVRRVDAEGGGRVSVTSDPFYTSEFGYKMCLRVYPAGGGVGRGTHLSVFAIMRGEFDDLLYWPFKQKVTISILDQESGQNDKSETFRSNINTYCNQSINSEFIDEFGKWKFIPLSLLMNSSRYCKNDTILFEICIHHDGLRKQLIYGFV